MPEKFQTVVFLLKKHQMFSVHTTPGEFRNATIIVIVVLCLSKTRSEGRHVIIVARSFSLNFQNVFRPHENEKPAFSDSLSLKNIFEKRRFRDGLL